jgi:protein SCO1/2
VIRLHRGRWLPALVVLFLALSLAGCVRHAFKGTLLDPPDKAPDFTLTDHQGRPFRLSEQRGKVTLLFFGFTSCPDVCPVGLAKLAEVQRSLGEDGEDVQVLFVTVDPERDTAEALGRYVTAFHPSFIGLRGTQEELDAVYKAYGVLAEKRELADSALGYTVDHSAYFYLIDRAGQWRELFSHNIEPEDMTGDVRYFVRQGGA